MSTPSDATIARNIGLNNGYIFGALYGGYTLAAYLINLEWFTITWAGTVLFVVGIVMMILSINTTKKALGGYIGFRDSFITAFITALVGSLINTIITILIFNIIDKSAAQTVIDILTDKMEAMMERFSVPQEKIDEAVANLDKTFALATQLRGFAVGLAFYAAISAVLAAFLKKKRPLE
ncbi:MAG: DUF4199 domain-containing protein [Thermaurantimonas sp.]|uniref:DUF4199 domain-containing protein n=1 Tax=Thermaurantimonas sp. TaxID=2681568 RepID=UPI00391DA0CE